MPQPHPLHLPDMQAALPWAASLLGAWLAPSPLRRLLKGAITMTFDLAKLKAFFEAAKPGLRTLILFAEFMIPGADGPAKRAFVVKELAALIGEAATAAGLPSVITGYLTSERILGACVDAFVQEMNALGLLGTEAPAEAV